MLSKFFSIFAESPSESESDIFRSMNVIIEPDFLFDCFRS